MSATRCGLTRLPDNLPAGLVYLDVTECRGLTGLPGSLPGGLRSLFVGLCHGLTELPENLPDSLQVLIAEYCRLTHLPEHLPASLVALEVSDNNLNRLPESLTAPRSGRAVIYLENNPLPQRLRTRLAEVLNAEGYQGPRVLFSMHNPQQNALQPDSGQPRLLHHAAASWMGLTGADAAATALQWENFDDEPGAQAFAEFLDRLRGTVNFSNPQFRASVAEWLPYLEMHPTLRENTFAVSEAATTSCEDSISLIFNGMRQLRLAHDVEQGHYDHRLPELLTMARGMFRIDQLEGIAREKANSLNFVDQIEVYLAYQVKLREPLALPLDTPDMRFFHVSYVTQTDLDQAQARVLAAEQLGFAAHLCTDWQPWQSVLQRLAPERHAQAQHDIIEAMGDEFNNRMQSRLQEMGLENDADAQRTLGPRVQAEITREINGHLTRDFLASRGLLEYVTGLPDHAPMSPLDRADKNDTKLSGR